MFLAQYSAFSSFGKVSASNSAALRPLRTTVAAMYSPLAFTTRSSLLMSTAAFRAKASAAGVGCPSLYATLVAGPTSCSFTSACWASTLSARTAMRRGVEKAVRAAWSLRRRSRRSRSEMRFASSSRAPSIMRAGISSQPISSNRSAISFESNRHGSHGPCGCLLLVQIRLGNSDSKRSNASDHTYSLCD